MKKLTEWEWCLTPLKVNYLLERIGYIVFFSDKVSRIVRNQKANSQRPCSVSLGFFSLQADH